MDKLVTVIVPFYNAQDYIRRCVESIKAQTYKNLQVIFVNDGSTDRSSELCKCLIKDDERFELIEQENKGVSAARNVGINATKGKYCCFVDADDFVAEDYVEYMVRSLLKYNADISTCTHQIEYERGKWKNTTKGKEGCLNQEQGLINFFSKDGMKAGPVCKLYKMDILNNYKIRFNESIKIAEDKLFCYEYLIRCEKIHFSAEAKYFYVLNWNSASNKKYIPVSLDDDSLPFKTFREIEKTVMNQPNNVVSYYLAFASKVYTRMVFKYNLFSYLSDDEIKYIREFVKNGYKKGMKSELINSKKNYLLGIVIIHSTLLTKWICLLKRFCKKRL